MEDFLFWSGVGLNFAGGLLGIDPAVIAASACALFGACVAPAARLAGRGVRAGWRLGRRLALRSPISAEALAVLDRLDAPSYLADDGNVRAGNLIVSPQGDVWVVSHLRDKELSERFDYLLTGREKKLIGKKAREKAQRLGEAAIARRRTALRTGRPARPWCLSRRGGRGE